MKKIAVVTGAGRGLGWGTAKELAAKGFHVALLGRDTAKLEARKQELASAGAEATTIVLDLSDPASIERAAAVVVRAFRGQVDVLVNNAGVFPEGDAAYDPEKARLAMQVNALGPLQFSLGMATALRAGTANVVNVSSGMGGLAEMNGGYPGYRISKTALNAVTRYLSQEWRGIRVNSVCPGWVRTDMGGPNASRSVEEAVPGILWAALLAEDGPTGGFFRDGKPLPW